MAVSRSRRCSMLLAFAAFCGGTAAIADGFKKLVEAPLPRKVHPVILSGTPPGTFSRIYLTDGEGLKCRSVVIGGTLPTNADPFPQIVVAVGSTAAKGQHLRSCEHLPPTIPPHDVQLESFFTWHRELWGSARTYRLTIQTPPGNPPDVRIIRSVAQMSAIFTVTMRHTRDGNTVQMTFDSNTEGGASTHVVTSPPQIGAEAKRPKTFPDVTRPFLTAGLVSSIWTIDTISTVRTSIVLDGFAKGRSLSTITAGGPVTDCP